LGSDIPLLIPAVAAATAVVVEAVDEEQVEDGVEDGRGRDDGCFSTVDAGLNLRLVKKLKQRCPQQFFSLVT
jgi:hypothetical protein